MHPGSTSSGVFSGIEPVAADVGLGLGAVRMTATWEAVRTLHADSELVVLTKARRRWPRSKSVEEHASEDGVAEDEDVLRQLDERAKSKPALPGSGPGRRALGIREQPAV